MKHWLNRKNLILASIILLVGAFSWGWKKIAPIIENKLLTYINEYSSQDLPIEIKAEGISLKLISPSLTIDGDMS